MYSRWRTAAAGHASPWEEYVNNNNNNSKEQIATQSQQKFPVAV